MATRRKRSSSMVRSLRTQLAAERQAEIEYGMKELIQGVLIGFIIGFIVATQLL